ncbi:copper chaperone PCu(A)C [Streptomyces phytohabitans]|uniref:copper chaperone PCu(A)C n=1 Tax=Streptomyces phytohabitans TaxID=1150371 RepID=UPI00345B91F3
MTRPTPAPTPAPTPPAPDTAPPEAPVPEAPHPWAPTRARLRDGARAAAVPLAAWLLALGGLGAWAATGHAGSPARLTVTGARMYVPGPGVPETAAFFRVTNSGGARDRLLAVTSTAVDGDVSLSRHRMTERGAAYRDEATSLPVPAGGTLDMSPLTADVTVPASPRWRVGDRVPFTLRFEYGGRVDVVAEVVRPGDG